MSDAIREWYAAAPKQWRDCWCGARGGRTYTHPDRHGVVLTLMACDACTTVRVMNYLSDSAIADLYANRYRALFDTDGPDALFAGQIAHGKGVKAYLGIGAVGVIVDYGSGAGGFLAAFPDAGRRIGIEPGEYARHGKDAGHDMEIVDDARDADSASADYVFAMHTIEHRVDLKSALRDHMRLMKPGGKMVVEVPDLGAYRENYQTLSRYLQTPHYWQFTGDTLIAAAESVGLRARRSAPGALVEFDIGGDDSATSRLLVEGGAACTGRY